jgi:hypothetical protein
MVINKIVSINEYKLQDNSEEKVLVIYNVNDFFIHNGVDTLIMLNDKNNISVSVNEILEGISSTGTHLVVEAKSMDVALDFYNIWKRCQSKRS